jgi:hypothetical protein
VLLLLLLHQLAGKACGSLHQLLLLLLLVLNQLTRQVAFPACRAAALTTGPP